MELELEAVELIVRAREGKTKENKNKFGDLEDIALRVLREVANGSENDSARVRAAELMLEKSASAINSTNFSYEDVAEALAKSKNKHQAIIAGAEPIIMPREEVKVESKVVKLSNEEAKLKSLEDEVIVSEVI